MKRIIFIFLVLQSVTAFAQFSDNFNDGLFQGEMREVNWTGDVAEFRVNEALQLQLNSSVANSPAQLRTPSSMAANTRWKFYVKMNFNPTASNYAKVYLTSDEPNLNADLNGLFVRIGYTDKNICLMRSKKGSNNSTLIAGERQRLNLTSVAVTIKATLDTDGKFNLYSRLETESDFVLEGSCDLSDIPVSNWFGLVCIFTATRSAHFFFDNFVVQDLDEEDLDEEDPKPDLPQEGDVIINEILFNPPTGGNEYVELYNRSDKTFDLRYLSITSRRPSDGSFNTIYPLTASPLLLHPGEYVVVTRNRNLVCEFFDCREESLFAEPTSMPSLANTSGCAVILNNVTNEIVDQFYYSETMHSKSIPSSARKGVALERIHPDLPADEASSWASASSQSGYGTPGYINSQYSEHTGIQNPNDNFIAIEYPALGDDRYGIRYRLDKPDYNGRLFIYDAVGRKVNTVINNELLGSQGVIYWNGQSASGRKLQSGIYIVYLEIVDLSGVVHKFKTPAVVR